MWIQKQKFTTDTILMVYRALYLKESLSFSIHTAVSCSQVKQTASKKKSVFELINNCIKQTNKQESFDNLLSNYAPFQNKILAINCLFVNKLLLLTPGPVTGNVFRTKLKETYFIWRSMRNNNVTMIQGHFDLAVFLLHQDCHDRLSLCTARLVRKNVRT